MNDSERRRRELLRQTRKLYEERGTIPAVHPRYGRIYHDLYREHTDENRELSGGSFYLRLVIGILCFVCFVYMDQSSDEAVHAGSSAIVEQIGNDLDEEADAIIEAWKNM